MTRLTQALFAASALVLGGCQYFGARDASGTPAASVPAVPETAPAAALLAPAAEAEVMMPATLPESCDVLASRGWEAWVDRMPGPDTRPAMHIAGQVDVRSGGYTFEWITMPTDRSATPAYRVILVATPPSAPATQAITTEAVKYTGPALAGAYSRAIIGCGTVTIGTVTTVRDTY